MPDSLNRQRAEPHCSRGRPPSVCCVGEPWDSTNIAEQIMYWGEPLYPSVIEVAARAGLDPHELAGHVEGEHGWEPHNVGYDKAVEQAAACMLAGAKCGDDDA